MEHSDGGWSSDARSKGQPCHSIKEAYWVLAWVQEHARPTTAEEKHTWAEQIDRYRPDEALVEYRKRVYPELAAQIDVGPLSVLDLIDMDEGRLPING